MNWKDWPYWVKGGIISAGCILLFAIIVSMAVASSSLCGLNTAGESHTCNLSERVSAFGEIMRMVLIFPFLGTFYSILEYHSIKMLWQTSDGFPIFLIIVGLLLLGSGVGWLYGKIKNRKSSVAS